MPLENKHTGHTFIAVVYCSLDILLKHLIIEHIYRLVAPVKEPKRFAPLSEIHAGVKGLATTKKDKKRIDTQKDFV